ncbi:WD40 repeat domain-containing protein [Leptolyngbyaceae cyanobacterium UHCC 1019]
MFGVKTKKQGGFERHWQGTLADYVTAIAWSPNGHYLAATSAASEVSLLNVKLQHLTLLETSSDQSMDCIAFSHDGKFLAAAGQQGQVKIWQVQSESPVLIATLETRSTWIDRLAWSSTHHHLAFQLGFCLQIWDAATAQVVETLSLDATAQDFCWHPDGQALAIAVKNSVRIWNTQTWEIEHDWETAAPSSAIAWSPDGKYIAAGGHDRTLLVWQWGVEYPWRMEGFPGKVSHLAWSDSASSSGAPLLVASSADGMVKWEKDQDEQIGWNATELKHHQAKISAIAFQPKSFLLASAAKDGQLCLWHHAKTLALTLEGAPHGFSCLAWHPQGQQLAAGGENGELFIWSQALPGKGFGHR